ncbi:hypothetical protein HYY74_03110 [Candidatus Woesearchaeota archaeon]|nr:hypothetical protein [Candidatus Woesearchaeota archaeon]
MLISEKLNSAIRVLLVNSVEGRPNLTFSELAKKCHTTPSLAKRLALKLIRSEYAAAGRGIRGIRMVRPERLAGAWGYLFSIRELEKAEFIAAERPQYVMLKIANAARANGLKYAFTLFSATEQMHPYVAPADTHMYILKTDLMKWQRVFNSQNIQSAEGNGNIVCFLVDESYFEGVWDSRGAAVVSLPQLCADLRSYGGRGEEAGMEILKLIGEKLKNV